MLGSVSVSLRRITLSSARSRLLALLSLPNIAFAVLLLVIGVLAIYPTAMLIFGSLWSAMPGREGYLTLNSYARAWSDPEVYQLIFNSVWIIGTKTFIAMVLGGLLAFLVTRTDLPYRRLLQVLITLPVFVPGLITAIGWAALASPNAGYLNQLTRSLFGQSLFNIYSYEGLIWVMSIDSAAFAFILMLGSMGSFDLTLEESSRLSGASRLATLRRITLPLMAPLLMGSFILMFIRGIEAFETPAILGTPARIYFFTNKIYDALRRQEPPDFALAMALAAILLVLTLILLAVQWRVLAGKQYTTVRGSGKYQRISLGRWRKPMVAFVVLYFVISTILPVSVLVLSSFFKVFGLIQWNLFTLDNYRFVFSDKMVLRALWNSFALAVSVATVTMLIGCAAAYIITRTNRPGKRVLEMLVWIPWTLPGMALGLGVLWAYIKIPYLGISLYGTVWILVVAYMTKGLPLSVRTVSDNMRQISKDLEESARVHGGSWLHAFRTILLALAWPGFMVGWTLIFFSLMRDLSASILLYSYGTEVISVVIMNYWESGKGQMVSVLSVFMVAVMFLILGIDRLLRKEWHA